MAYKALYRTYRPTDFDEVAGQDHVVKTLQHAVEQNKIAHAYLFCGPRGTGKTSIAKIFAKMINCESEEHQPCNHCDNCLAVLDGTHPDIIEIDAASNNGVEEVRNLIEKVKYAPLKGKYKIYIIDEVHMMSTGAFNALLKTIEEPPAHVIFILATTEPHKVIPTIISRCQRFDFTKVPDTDMIQRLKTVLEAENITCEDEVVRIIAQLADGGLRDALSILDQCIAYAQNNLEVHHINEIYGITTVKEKINVFDLIFQKNAMELLQTSDQMIEKGIDIKRLTNDLIEVLKETLVFAFTKEAKLLHILNSEEALHILEQVSTDELFEMIRLLMETYDKYRFAANANSYFEVCLLKMLDVTPTTQAKEIPSVTHMEKIVEPKKEKIESVSRETLLTNTEIEKKQVEKKVVQPDIEVDMLEDPSMIPSLEENEVEINSEPIRKEPKSITILSDELILRLLAGANKPEKAADIESFKRIDEYRIDLKWGKFANLIKFGSIVGSGTNYIVLCVDNQAEANQINEIDKSNDFSAFLEELLHKSKKIFAIAKDQQAVVIQEFKERMINGTLPEPVNIEDVIIDKTVEKEKTEDEIVLDLFGQDNITIVEE